MADFRALLMGMLCLAIMIFPPIGASFFGVPHGYGDPAAASEFELGHHRGHSHDGDPAADEDASHEDRHAADHSHEMPAVLALPSFDIIRPILPQRIVISDDGNPGRQSGIKRPPRKPSAA